MLIMMSRVLTRSLNVSVARLASTPDSFLKSGESVQSAGVFRKTIPNAGMRDFNRSSTAPPVEYSRSRDIAALGTNCKTLSGEKTCARSCL